MESRNLVLMIVSLLVLISGAVGHRRLTQSSPPEPIKYLDQHVWIIADYAVIEYNKAGHSLNETTMRVVKGETQVVDPVTQATNYRLWIDATDDGDKVKSTYVAVVLEKVGGDQEFTLISFEKAN